MSNFAVTNNTPLPIHIASQWDGIVQEFINNIAPKTKVYLPAASFFGSQDFAAVIGTPANEFSHKQDWEAALGLAAECLGAIATISGLCVLPEGALAVGAAAGGATSLTAGVVIQVGEVKKVEPGLIKGIWGPDGANVNVSGGEIQVGTSASMAKGVGELTIKSIQPIKIEGVDKKTGVVRKNY